MTDGRSYMCRVMKAVDVATSRVKKWQPEAHPAAINALQVLPEGLIASGDDDGCIKLWDPRQAQAEAVASFTEHTDFIADFAYQVWPLSSHALWLFVWAGMHHQSTAMNLLGGLSVISSHDAICASSHSRGL